jgi:hypothetical protein
VKQALKRLVFGDGRRPRRVRFGVARGLVLLIDPAERTQRLLGLDEAEIARPFRRAVLRARTFIDVGASDGYYTLIAVRLNPTITAIGCGPDLYHEADRHENYRLNFPNGGPNVEWIPRFIGNGDTAPPEHQGIGVTSLDAVADARPGPIFVKVDVDGAELDVLRSGARVLRRADTAVLIEVHSAELEHGVVQMLAASGFRTRIVDNAWWRAFIPEQRPIALNRWVMAEKP